MHFPDLCHQSALAGNNHERHLRTGWNNGLHLLQVLRQDGGQSQSIATGSAPAAVRHGRLGRYGLKGIDVTEFESKTRTLLDNIELVVVGKTDVLRLLLAALFANGHVLFEDVPGVAKTLLARSLALSIGGTFRRVQCTPDLLPGDVTGVAVFNQKTADFEFRPGPIFTNILLADEINRATPRAQASLLECMAERQVTVDTETIALPDPFLVVATQNPIEHEGTFPLPEAQLDRFLMRLNIGYPTPRHELEILRRTELRHPIETLRPVLDIAEISVLQHFVRKVYVHDQVRRYMVDLTGATRETRHLLLGASPRATMALFRTAQAMAALDGRDHVLPDDVKAVMLPIIEHRVMLNPESRLRGYTVRRALIEVLDKVRVPTGVRYER
ncbi:AAA family ATPase [bacterium]|nr:AAA family ATPase [candidate division CSSED10-310 bacterium]